MKKSVIPLLILVLLFNILFILAANETGIDKSYACLESKLEDNCQSDSSISQIGFNLLAISYNSGLQSDCKSLLMSKKKDDCWPETVTGSCNIKSTAIAVLALENIQEKLPKSYANTIKSFLTL